MSKVSKRVEEIVKYADSEGREKCIKKYHITWDTISRYIRLFKAKKEKPPKILLFDIETTPMIAYVWNKSVYNNNVNPNHIIQEWFMLSWSAKWLYDSKIMSFKLTKEEALAKDDSRLIKILWEVFDVADIIIAHNAVNFDIGMTNTKFIKNGLNPPSPYRVIDTLKEVRKHFDFTYNRLDYVATELGIGNKITTDFNLWKECMKGNIRALKEMQSYNIQDVILLEDLYLKIRPYITSHPNYNAITGIKGKCPTCGSSNIVSRGIYTTNINQYEAFKCNDCGSYSRKTKNSLVSVAR